MKKRFKEVSVIYKGQSIVKNSPYSFRGFNVVLFYCPVEGIELYFKSIGKAKAHLDSLRNIEKIDNGIPF